jgi:hypothetical protein
MNFVIKEDFANAVLKYLTTRPYIEVHQFINGFQNLKPIEAYIQEQEIKEKAKKEVK